MQESSVFKAGVSLDSKMESSLRKFPVMLKKYSNAKLQSSSDASVSSATPSSESAESHTQSQVVDYILAI